MTIETPSDPDWNEGATALGSWQQITNAYASMLAVTVPLRRRLTFELFQGSAAVQAQLARSVAEEVRYQLARETRRRA
jgi:hypothetical protein